MLPKYQMLTGYQHFNKNIIPYLYITTIKIEGITRGKIRENLLSFPFYLLPLVSKVVTFIKKSGHLFSRDKLLFYRLLKPIYYDNKSNHWINRKIKYHICYHTHFICSHIKIPCTCHLNQFTWKSRWTPCSSWCQHHSFQAKTWSRWKRKIESLI